MPGRNGHEDRSGTHTFQGASGHPRQTYHSPKLLQRPQVFFESYGERELASVSSEELLHFLEATGPHLAPGTRTLRFYQLKAFFNFCRMHLAEPIVNPCDATHLQKLFARRPDRPPKILSKELVDEMIYSTQDPRDRLLLELQARSGMRIGEILKIRRKDVDGQVITISSPKSGKPAEHAYVTDAITERLHTYIREKKIQSDERVFPLSYNGARTIVMRRGERQGVRVRPHDLRRHAATYASRSGVPLEIVSKVILRHHDLRVTQVYLGEVSHQEAIRWMSRLHEK